METVEAFLAKFEARSSIANEPDLKAANSHFYFELHRVVLFQVVLLSKVPGYNVSGLCCLTFTAHHGFVQEYEVCLSRTATL